MKFTKLHLAGFKTFVEATDFLIEPGLTGIIGPNGCGKSNLVDAMRWVMGENSSKTLRGVDMDDVIFAGSGERPGRNMAEVRLVLDNTDRTAPAVFNDAEILEVSRRIERDEGSTYRVNGREVRARDVQLLFADASTGSRSAAIVRQGTIGEIIAVKPQARRRILEEAAGIAGLHSRRHEAELRLKGAEDNLLRLEDVLKQIEAQIDALKRQARQATRYRNLAADIRRQTALHALVNHREATESLVATERKLEADLLAVAEETRRQAETARLQAIAAHELPPLREAEQVAASELQKLVLARETLDGEEKRAKSRLAELERRLAQMNADLAREQALIEDAASVLARFDAEATELAEMSANDAEHALLARENLTKAEAALAISDKALGEAQTAFSNSEARRGALSGSLRDETQRLARFETELQQLRANLGQLRTELGAEGAEADLKAALDAAREAAQLAEERMVAAEATHAQAREAEARSRAPLAVAEREAQRLETEAKTLSKLLTAPTGGAWTAVVDEITVAKGYEAALGAALGEDLDAPTDAAAPAHWALTNAEGDPALPDGVEPLARYVTAPAALARRLAQIGVVTKTAGADLRTRLKPGQRLVSRGGDLWRWDGFTQAEEAPTQAARRLAEKNRLGDLLQDAAVARAQADALKRETDQISADLKLKATAETEARHAHREALRNVEAAREKASAAERKKAQVAAKLSALEEAEQRLIVNTDEAKEKRAKAEAALAELTGAAELSSRLDAARATAAQDRATATEARAALQAHLHESETRAKRRKAIAEECQSWTARRERALSQIGEFQSRLGETVAEREKLADAPNEFFQLRRALMNRIETAEAARRTASDARAAAEQRLADTDRAARHALETMSAAREEKARSEARLEAAREHLTEVARLIATDLQCAPEELAPLAGVDRDAPLPAAAEIATKLESLKQDRERLGAVNLRADEELIEIEASRTGLTAERDDLTEAIRRLRQAIQNLNKEGRERLLAAFDVVNLHFQELFGILFGGGTAELQLIESDDPLEAGLEVLARPPGKKPQVMTLLSGGEQALVAMSLIFAVFLTNPSPICVLDEVDAPLDDANVERFCDLLDEMRKRADTRFITITHNPISMARMDRLYGVTMAERGVSQLVSVDLAEAEKFKEAV
ncbi:chromosome segregation protein SMC [Methylovirgula sp. HY1]|uniref:chromosome segregation protein SMC n=1 Tax=Methylovirgula sp. HY1 TaxID=2822761 RepID=UPI001C5A6C91|nr:chromosome segregation protein SMC [Methylovirgula sp. HY1]QXX73385.1 Chromosome partition protein Smc [Methylovirgula sp. HY1]